MDELPLPDTLVAWQCIGCGRLEAPQNCVGVCQDRKVELVSAHDYADLLSRYEDASVRLDALEAFVRMAAHVMPRGDAWEASYRAFQAQARELVDKQRAT